MPNESAIAVAHSLGTFCVIEASKSQSTHLIAGNERAHAKQKPFFLYRKTKTKAKFAKTV